MLPIYLASSSPRRSMLLEQLGLPFTVVAPEVAEEVQEGLPPHQLVETLALRKAGAVEPSISKGLVVAADTVVVWQGKVLGKPADAREAAEMLSLLAGNEHEVFTGLAVMEKPSGRRVVTHERTRVRFRPLTTEEIARYVATGEPLDKAGAYAAQGLGAIFIAGIRGCYFNVVGLPLARLAQVLKEFGVDPLEYVQNN
ncbi:Maf family protein [Desulfofundulus thermosubterraneus]|uniref:dTTP/UTP pyrophosphatase n=1 Tax=Desulfofundulus thermosubterraneus DSM 16057 TaxID=1121432 RepID=A0A1M6FK10_9FIRM|nr:Maf family protein [Desulfofundulus thermosubterraneus]SHI98014.1 septum formation protein [Desulfofundulus thermosubterraneus DSM 16057]